MRKGRIYHTARKTNIKYRFVFCPKNEIYFIYILKNTPPEALEQLLIDQSNEICIAVTKNKSWREAHVKRLSRVTLQ